MRAANAALLIAAAILAARRLAQYEGTLNVPATITAIMGAIFASGTDSR